ncbi:MAG: O-methyltransferase [Lentimicrobiaceae bacterium]|nr:O-methyltransferase [Lentimicrobiaceae bacterium]
MVKIPNPQKLYWQVDEYAEKYSGKDLPLLQELYRETNLKTAYPQMITLPHQGRVLQFLSKVIRPKFVLDLGTFTGYSALCLAQGLQENGKLFTVDYNDETSQIALKYFKKAGLDDKIEYIKGNAEDVIKTLNYSFDIVYVDINKESYCSIVDLILPKLSDNGIIIVDNVLWYLRTVDNIADKDTMAVTKFNNYVQNRSDINNIMLPIGDGFMIITKN